MANDNNSLPNSQNQNLGKASFITASVMGIVFLLVPVLTLYFTWPDLFAQSHDWLWIDNSIVGICLLIVTFIIWIIKKENTHKLFILFFTPAFIGCILYFGLVISFFNENVRFQIKKFYYTKSANTFEIINFWVQKGLLEDFFYDDPELNLLKDKELITALAYGLKPEDSIQSISLGYNTKEYCTQAFIVYIAYREMGYSDKEIFSFPEGIWVLYGLAFLEANSDLSKSIEIPENFSKKYFSPALNQNFPLGILDNSKVELFFKVFLKQITTTNFLQTELAVFYLTQFPVDLNESDFNTILDHWKKFKPQYESEISFLQSMRNSLYENFKRKNKYSNSLKVNFAEIESYSWQSVKPFLTSTGFKIDKGNDFSLNIQMEKKFLKEVKITKTKPVRKTRSVSKTVRSYGSPVKYRTETREESYVDYVFDGYEIRPVYIYLFRFPGFHPTIHGLCGILSDCYLNAELETTLSPELHSRNETWIYALPKYLVCKKGCDGREITN